MLSQSVLNDVTYFSLLADGTVIADLVDRHGTQFADALQKFKGLATYAATHSDIFRRIEAVAEVTGRLKALDRTNARIREAVNRADDAAALYVGKLSGDYQ